MSRITGASSGPGAIAVGDGAASVSALTGDAPSRECGCWRCTKNRGEREGWDALDLRWHRMFLCSTCGNKRCPHATDHRFACTGSNATGQAGSNYGEEFLDAEGVRRLLVNLGTEAGSISAWARSRGIHPELALVVARGTREPEPRLLDAMGLTRVSVFVPRDSDKSGEAGETHSGSTEGDSAGRTSGIAQDASS